LLGSYGGLLSNGLNKKLMFSACKDKLHKNISKMPKLINFILLYLL
jgi:hypothetical protein